jgi:hypothetical protein
MGIPATIAPQIFQELSLYLYQNSTHCPKEDIGLNAESKGEMRVPSLP